MQSITKMFLVFLFIFIVWTLYMENDISNRAKNTEKCNELLESATRLERLLQFEREKVIELTEKIEKMKEEMVIKRDSLKIWKEPIPVLVFSCNRAMAVRDHVQKLIKYRPSAAKFPIIVSQDCDNERVRNEILKFGDKVQYIKHVAGDKVNITIPKKHKNFTSYYRIARHYRLALNHVLKDMEHTSVIITEDDLDISPDFFSYFSNTRYLLEEDPSLWCVTAWNDNGKSDTIDLDAAGKLYRSDFFAGLGWMMTAQTWQELEPIWPASFWDDWMRDGLRRKDRQCIRPEVSRTGMLAYGQHGASKGQFFNKHLSYVKVNDQFTNFGELDLDYLLPSNFEKRMKEEVYGESSLIEIDEVAAFISKPENKGKSVRVNYDGNIDFIRKADQLNVMNDFKAGVPRTAYDGIVTCFINGIRIYLVPDRTKVPGYISNWTVPDSFQD